MKALVTIVALAILAGLGWGLTETIQAEHRKERAVMSNRDPRLGPVFSRYESPRTSKVCDGRNLVYRSTVRGGQSISVSANDPQCQP